jgi:hypothetical protein
MKATKSLPFDIGEKLQAVNQKLVSMRYTSMSFELISS